MNNVRSLRHTVWECKYHVVWVPKYRRKVLYGEIRRYLGEVILWPHRRNAVWKRVTCDPTMCTC